jgi:toxin ParE1/3/4
LTRFRLEISEAAAADILEQAEWYESRASGDVAAKWERAVTATVLRILEYPHAGPVTVFKNPELANIRRIPVNDFPRHLIFYRISGEVIVIVRLVHGARDLQSLFF